MQWSKNRLRLIGLDTNIFIYHFQKNPKYVVFTRKIFGSLAKNKLRAVTSLITLTELLSQSLPNIELKILKESFNSTPGLTTIDPNREIALEAARIRREHCIRLPDALQLATALNAKAQIFITNDKHLKRFKEVKVVMITDI